MGITYRLAQLQDAMLLEEFLAFNNGEKNRELAQHYIRCMFSEDYRKPYFVVALNGSEIVGAAAYSQELFTTGTWGISWVSVHKDHRQQGIGRALVQQCEAQIRETADKRVMAILGTYPEKTKLYEDLGYVKAGQDFHGGWYMLKELG